MNKKERKFVTAVWQYYEAAGRHTLPWRKTRDPYRVLVSEVMLQQTQALRVVPMYKAFLKRFPTALALARSPLRDVLTAWQGLGYNRRAKALHETAKNVSEMHKGRFPKTYKELLELPGVGPYTAGAVMAFAYNEAVPILETNIRTVYLHHFFKDDTDVEERELLKLVERTLDPKKPRDWYYALMDYGAHLKQVIGNQNRRARAYSRQSAFKGSDREIRGAVVRELSKSEKCTRASLHVVLSRFDKLRIDAQLERLLEEGMVTRQGRSYSLPD